jgi:hydrogenase assembly chaperone HypC/HupF
MCRSTVARVVALDGTDAVVDFDGVHRRATTTFVPEVQPGDHVLIGLGAVLGIVAPADVAALRDLEARGRAAVPADPTGTDAGLAPA